MENDGSFGRIKENKEIQKKKENYKEKLRTKRTEIKIYIYKKKEPIRYNDKW